MELGLLRNSLFELRVFIARWQMTDAVSGVWVEGDCAVTSVPGGSEKNLRFQQKFSCIAGNFP
jgi:hypothetical protein